MGSKTGPDRGRSWIARLGVVLGILSLVLTGAQEASAQRLRGRLLDLQSGEPVKSGFLTLRSAEGVVLSTTMSDEEGRWGFDLPEAGTFYLEATRLDYEPWVAGPLEIEAGDDLTSIFRLRRRPIELEPLEVSVAATRHHLAMEGFYDRQRSDFGMFLGPDDIERRTAHRITDLLLGLPGVRMVSMTSGSVGARFIQLRGSSLSQGGVCRPRIFVDGLLYALGDSRPIEQREGEETEMEETLDVLDQGLSLDDIGPPSDLAAIEVYRSATEVPVQFGGTSVQTLCGVIVVWTKRGIVRIPD